MRSNLDSARIARSRHFAMKWTGVTMRLVGVFVVPVEGPMCYFLDPNGADRNVVLPELEEERFVVIANTGSANELSILDADSNVLTNISADGVGLFIAASEWRWILQSRDWLEDIVGITKDVRVVTASGTITATATDAGIAVNKSVAAATAVQLGPVAARLGMPLRIIDWKGDAETNNITILPNGAETIMGEVSLVLASNKASVMLYPSINLSTWYLAP